VSLTRLWAMARKEFIHVWRDSRSLTLALIIPIFLMLLYCYALSMDIEHIPLVVLDLDRTVDSRHLVERFTSSGYFDLTRFARNYRDTIHALDSGAAVMALVIPRRYSRLMNRNADQVPLQVILDGSDPNRASIALGYAQSIAQVVSSVKMSRAAGVAGMSLGGGLPDTRVRVWFNPEMKSRFFIIPGLIALIMAILAALLTSLTVAREWEQNTMEMLISTPVKGSEIILGKLLPYFIIGLVDTGTIVLTGRYVFNVPLRGSLVLLLLSVAIFLLGVLAFGIMISVIVRSQLVSSQAAMLAAYVPTILLSGFVFQINSMALPLQLLSYIVPARYLIACLKAIYLKGVGFQVIQIEILYMLIFTVLALTLAFGCFRKRLE